MPVSRSFRSVPYIAAGDSFISKARDISTQDTRNMYVLSTPNSKTQAALISYPGLLPWSTGGATGADRGVYRREFKGLGYQVAGTNLYSISSGGQRAYVGTIAGDERVSMIDNGQVLLVVGGGRMYQYDGTTLTTLSTVSGSGVTFTPVDVDYLNDKFIALADNGLIYVANVGETNFVNGFYDAESSPDSTIAIQVFDQTVINLGTDSIEPWEDIGSGTPPLARVAGGIIENTGVANKNAVDITSDALYFLGRDMIPYAMVNFLSSKLTEQNPGIAELFREYTRDTATVYALKWKGQEFVQFRFPTEGKVWVFSPNTGLWFQLDHGVNKQLYRGASTAFLFNRQVVADYESGELYTLDDDTYTNNGVTIVRERTFRPLSGETLGVGRTALQMRSIQYDVETGVGLADQNPQMVVQYSTDGGRSFSNERWLYLGKTGDYVTVEDNSNRKFNDLTVRIKYTEPTAFTIYNANLYVREAGRLISRFVGSQVANSPTPPPPNPFVWDSDKIPSDGSTTWLNESVVRFDFDINAAAPAIAQVMGPVNLRDRFSKVYLEFKIESGDTNPISNTSSDIANISAGLAPYSLDSSYARAPAPNYGDFLRDATVYSGYPTAPIDIDALQYYGASLCVEQRAVKVPDRTTPTLISTTDFLNKDVGDVIMVAFDFTTARVWFGANGVWWQDFIVAGSGPVSGTRADYGPIGSDSATKIGGAAIDSEFYPIVSFHPSTTVNDSVVDVTIYGNDTAPFNYPVPPGYNGT